MTAEVDVLIVGGGLFGRVAQKALLWAGRDAHCIDDARPDAGSGPAACLMKPSWLTKMDRADREHAFEVLERLYGVQWLKFSLGPLKVGDVAWVPPAKILNDPTGNGRTLYGRVFEIAQREFHGKHLVSFRSSGGQVGRVACSNLIVAAGVWCSELFPEIVQKAQGGWAHTWKMDALDAGLGNFIQPWAPYRQITGFHRGPTEYWIGDAQALKPESCSDEQRARSLGRCADAAELPPEAARTHFGYRPYASGLGGKPALVHRVGDRVWVATGGAKNGTIGAAWAAREMVEKTL